MVKNAKNIQQSFCDDASASVQFLIKKYIYPLRISLFSSLRAAATVTISNSITATPRLKATAFRSSAMETGLGKLIPVIPAR